MRQAQQRTNVVVIAHETQLCPLAGAKVAHGLGQAARELLDAQHVGLAASLEAHNPAQLLISGGVGQQLGQISKSLNDGRAVKRAG